MTTRAAEDLFERMRRNYALVRELGLPGIQSEYWGSLLSAGRQDYGGKGNFIEREDLWENFRNNVVTKGLDNANVGEESLSRAREKCRSLHARVVERIPDRLRPHLEESPVGNPPTFAIDGQRVTQSSLEHTFMLAHLEPYLDEARVIVDVGGGYGGLARLIKTAYPDRTLVLLDLPEINAVQTYFLSRSFPGATILGLSDVADHDLVDVNRLGCDFLVLPGQLIERLAARSFDVVINTRSMMEMDLETVSFYLSHVQDKLATGGVFYCINRYEKKTRLKDYPFDDRWYVSRSEPWPEWIDQNPHHELVAVRAAFPVAGGLRQTLSSFPPFEGPIERLRAKLKSFL